MYVAIIGDLVRSRQIRDRNAVQCQLQAALDQVNKKYADQIAANFLITLGDEFQGILQEPGCLMPILSDIADAIRPVQVRFGVGIGELTTEVNRNAAIGADGPAFYRARSAIPKPYSAHVATLMTRPPTSRQPAARRHRPRPVEGDLVRMA